MARVYSITKRLSEYKIDEKTQKEIIGNGDLVDITARMEELLEVEMIYQILDSCACGTGKKEIAGLKEIDAETLKGKSDAIAQLGDFHSDWDIILNQDDTLTAGWHIKKEKNYACVCPAIVKNKVKVSDLIAQNRTMSLTYCFCCAGHCRQHLQKLLGIQLKTKEIVSSPINSGGEKPCEFIFKIV